jgi:hypothetical protein
VELYLHTPNTPSWRGAQLKHKDNFTLPLKIKIQDAAEKRATIKTTIIEILFS